MSKRSNLHPVAGTEVESNANVDGGDEGSGGEDSLELLPSRVFDNIEIETWSDSNKCRSR